MFRRIQSFTSRLLCRVNLNRRRIQVNRGERPLDLGEEHVRYDEHVIQPNVEEAVVPVPWFDRLDVDETFTNNLFGEPQYAEYDDVPRATFKRFIFSKIPDTYAECQLCAEEFEVFNTLCCSRRHKLVCNECITVVTWGANWRTNMGIAPIGEHRCVQCQEPVCSYGVGMDFNPFFDGYVDCRTYRTYYKSDKFLNYDVMDPDYEGDDDTPLYVSTLCKAVRYRLTLKGFIIERFQEVLKELLQKVTVVCTSTHVNMFSTVALKKEEDAHDQIVTVQVLIGVVTDSIPDISNCGYIFRNMTKPIWRVTQALACCYDVRVEEPFRSNDPGHMAHFNSVNQTIGNTVYNSVDVRQCGLIPIREYKSYSYVQGRYVNFGSRMAERIERFYAGVDYGYLSRAGYTHMRNTTVYPVVFEYLNIERAGVKAIMDNFNANLQILCEEYGRKGYCEFILRDTLMFWYQYKAWENNYIESHTIPVMHTKRVVPFMSFESN